MNDRRVLVLGLFLALFLFHVPQSHAVDIPITVQDAIEARADQNHRLQPPVVDAGPAMQGVYIYFLMSATNVSGGDKIDSPYMLDAHLLFCDEKNNWHDVVFDRYMKDDGVPEISAVFFANADHDRKDREVVVLVRTPLNHYDYGGEYYDGYVYKLTGNPRMGGVFARLQSDASAPFLDQCECDFRDGSSTHAHYKDTESIRKVLEKKYPASTLKGK